jgi:hypothetical protein
LFLDGFSVDPKKKTAGISCRLRIITNHGKMENVLIAMALFVAILALLKM